MPTTRADPSTSAPPEFPGSDRAGEALRVADRHHQLTDAKLDGVAERGRCEIAALGPQHRQI